MGEKRSIAKWYSTSNGIFAIFTSIAIFTTIILIILSRLGASTSGYFILPTNTALSPTKSTTITIPTTTSTTTLTEVFVSGTSRGSTNAPITIIEYSDFQCANCQAFALTTQREIEKAYIETGIARLIYKHRIMYDKESILAAQAAECAAEQNKFWEYYNLLMQIRATPGKEDITRAKLQDMAQSLGLDMSRFNSSLESEKYRDKVMQETEEGKTMGVTGTPTFFVNGVKGVGAAQFKLWRDLIEQLLRE
jgi:protein-disulfide isomerase